MALDPRKRQKKLAKRKAQRKEKAKKLTVQQQASSDTNRLVLAARYPIYQCLSNVTIFAGGMGTVMFSRRAPNGDIVLGVFLLDTFCLGVKSVFTRVLLPHEYDEMVASVRTNELLQAVEPAYARKLIEEAAAYAANLGFAPDPDYHTAKAIFGDVDVSECTDIFRFGKDGKPFYVSGPLDSPFRRQQILATLEKKCGAGNFEHLAHSENLGFDFDDFDEFDDEDFDAFDDDDDDPSLLIRKRE